MKVLSYSRSACPSPALPAHAGKAQCSRGFSLASLTRGGNTINSVSSLLGLELCQEFVGHAHRPCHKSGLIPWDCCTCCLSCHLPLLCPCCSAAMPRWDRNVCQTSPELLPCLSDCTSIVAYFFPVVCSRQCRSIVLVGCCKAI